jgi:hypothetical protein
VTSEENLPEKDRLALREFISSDVFAELEQARQLDNDKFKTLLKTIKEVYLTQFK